MAIQPEFTWAQSLTQNWPGWLRGLLGVRDWTPPKSDIVERPLDTRQVVESVSVDWPASHRTLRVDTNANATVWAGSLPHVPAQRVAPNAPMVTFTEINPWLGNATRRVQLPVPVQGAWWVEGNPTIGGAWDRHWFGHCPETGVSFEVIGVNVAAKTCLSSSRWRNGELIDGHASIASGSQWLSKAWNRGDPPHRLSLVMDDYGGGDGTRIWQFPRCGDVVRLSHDAFVRLGEGADPEQLAFLAALYVCGAEIADRSHAPSPSVKAVFVAGSQWAGSTLPLLDVRVVDLEYVTATA